MANIIEVCYRHVELILTKMNDIQASLEDGSEISEFFGKNKKISDFIVSVEDAISKNSQIPKYSGPSDILTVGLSKVIVQTRTLIYFCKYINQLQKLFEKFPTYMKHLNFEWNQYLSIRFCNLFVIFYKILLFFSKYKNCLNILLLYFAYEEKDIKQANYDLIKQYIKTYFKQSPIQLLKRSILNSKQLIIEFLSEISNPLSSIIEKFAFDRFSIFYVDQNSRSTLPSIECFILANFQVIKDTTIFSFLTFPDLTKSYKNLFSNVMAECPYMVLSDRVSVNLMDIVNFVLLSPDSKEHNELIEKIELLSKKAYSMHSRRMIFLSSLISEYCNFGKIYMNTVLTNYTKLVALVSFATYEMKSLMCIITDEKSPELTELIGTLFEIFDFMKKQTDEIRRFFIYNIATIDLQYLNEILKTIQNSLADPIIYQEIQNMANSLTIIDLDKFDSGENYDFMPFQLNVGRLLFNYNSTLMKYPGSFIGNIFEHLTNTLYHIEFYLNEFVKLDKLYKVAGLVDIFIKYANDNKIPLNQMAYVLRLFNKFNEDPSIMPDSQKRVISDAYQLINGSLSKRCDSLLKGTFSKESPYIRSHVIEQSSESFRPIRQNSKTYSNRPANKFSGRRSKAYSRSTVLNFAQIKHHAEFKKLNYQLIDFYENVPKTIKLFDQTENSYLFYRNQIINKIPYFAFQETLPSAKQVWKANTAVAEFLWPIFSLAGVSYSRIVFNFRLKESMNPLQYQFLAQARLFIGKAEQDELLPHASNQQFLINQYKQKYDEFFKGEYKNSIYLTTLNGFYPKGENTGNFAFQNYFSLNAFKALVDDFGPHFALQLDSILNNVIADTIVDISKGFSAVSTKLIEHLNRYREHKTLPFMSEINQDVLPAFEKMIQLGSAIAIRRLLRKQLNSSCEAILPGFPTFLKIGEKQNSNYGLNSKEKILLEIFCGSSFEEDKFYFIKEKLVEGKIMKLTDFSCFSFFLSLLLVFKLEDVGFNHSYESMTNNLHLFPVAMSIFIDCRDVLFDACDEKTVKEGMKLFFNVFALVFNRRFENSQIMKDDKTDADNQAALHAIQMLATLFPKYIPILECGFVDNCFPLLEMSQILFETQNLQQAQTLVK